ncbi:MAG: hypothetical protein JW733_03635 [Coriobacteriia bacterium]|nr:hypothetical protein [Coriobacteriia bacterium]MBN2839615.1 hypothetical protein [Coriobacteriia bacterium]
MKKTLLVVAIATVIVFALGGSAMAKVGNGYVTWDDASAHLDGTAATPHIGYTAATEKCAVCHSVHNAPVGGTTYTAGVGDPANWTASGSTEMLLRSSVANACVYCHIDTAVGGTQLYDGTAALWTGPTGLDENAAHNRNSANCVNCHAVHGANTYLAEASTKILKFQPAANRMIQDEVLGATGLYATAADAKADTGALGKDYQVTAFCTQCHANFSNSSEMVLNADGSQTPYTDSTYLDGDATVNTQYKSHPMKSAETTFVASGATYSGQVAWAGSSTCRSCHDAGATDEGVGVTDSNFPHYTVGAYAFVNVAANSGDTAAPSGLDHGSDGMCLKCHVNADGTAGVGTTF